MLFFEFFFEIILRNHRERKTGGKYSRYKFEMWHRWSFFDREQSSKVLKEALLLFSAWWKHEQKISKSNKKMWKGTKNVLWNKKCASVAHYGNELPCLHCMALCGLVCPYVALYGLIYLTSYLFCYISTKCTKNHWNFHFLFLVNFNSPFILISYGFGFWSSLLNLPWCRTK